MEFRASRLVYNPKIFWRIAFLLYTVSIPSKDTFEKRNILWKWKLRSICCLGINAFWEYIWVFFFFRCETENIKRDGCQGASQIHLKFCPEKGQRLAKCHLSWFLGFSGDLSHILKQRSWAELARTSHLRGTCKAVLPAFAWDIFSPGFSSVTVSACSIKSVPGMSSSKLCKLGF